MSPAIDRVGHVINQRYEILEVVGRGGQGIVYKSRDRWMDRVVAVKVVGSKAAREVQMVERLTREQQALTVLKGTAAVELFDVCRGSSGELCLVMELLKGVDLDEHLYTIEKRAERLGLPRIAEIFDPIVHTLEVAHEAGILHRDLKPANVFLLEEGGVRLLDFGLARLRSAAPLTAAGTIMGSPSFMAPEAWKGQSELVDHRADVYSLGVILFRVLAGDLPFAGESLQDKFLGSTEGKRPSLLAFRPELPRDIDAWVAQALAIDREERFQNVRALWTAFLATLRLPPSKTGKQRSLWSAARNAVKKVAGTIEKVSHSARTPHTSEESFGREALSRSMLYAPTPSGDDEVRVPLAVPPPERAGARRIPQPPPRPAFTEAVEKTLEVNADVVATAKSAESAAAKPSEVAAAKPSEGAAAKPSEVAAAKPPESVERTLELSGADLLREKTITDAPAPPRAPPRPPPRRAKRSSGGGTEPGTRKTKKTKGGERSRAMKRRK